MNYNGQTNVKESIDDHERPQVRHFDSHRGAINSPQLSIPRKAIKATKGKGTHQFSTSSYLEYSNIFIVHFLKNWRVLDKRHPMLLP